MDLGNLGAVFAANKVPILATAAAGVTGFALYKRHQGASSTAAGAGDSSASAGGQTAGMTGGGAYDSSASDLYGAIQPQLESLGNQVTSLQDKLNSVPVAKAPTPAKPTPSTAKPATPKLPTYRAGYYKAAGTDLTYFYNGSTLDWLSKAEGRALGVNAGGKNAAQVKLLPVDATLWNNKYTGTGPQVIKLPSNLTAPAKKPAPKPAPKKK
jgi:hypothetical protein